MAQIKVIKDDITRQQVDVIVNAANSSLLGGGGVDGAIHRAAGPALFAECKALNGCKTGDIKITKGYQLPCKYVFHAVGPIWQGGEHNEEELLKSCYLRSLESAIELKAKSIAFPNISTGVYHFPKEQAAKAALETVQSFFQKQKKSLDVYFVCFDDENFEIYNRLLPNYIK